jgi:hypothetical protein
MVLLCLSGLFFSESWPLRNFYMLFLVMTWGSIPYDTYKWLVLYCVESGSCTLIFQDLLRKLQEDSSLPFDFAEGTLYLDPDIIDLTMIPPPITPDEVSIPGNWSELKLEIYSGFCTTLTQVNNSNICIFLLHLTVLQLI